MSNDAQFIRPKQLAKALNLDVQTIYNYCKDGKIPHIRLIHEIRIPRAYLDDLLSVYDRDEPPSD